MLVLAKHRARWPRRDPGRETRSRILLFQSGPYWRRCSFASMRVSRGRRRTRRLWRSRQHLGDRSLPVLQGLRGRPTGRLEQTGHGCIRRARWTENSLTVRSFYKLRGMANSETMKKTTPPFSPGLGCFRQRVRRRGRRGVCSDKGFAAASPGRLPYRALRPRWRSHAGFAKSGRQAGSGIGIRKTARRCELCLPDGRACC